MKFAFQNNILRLFALSFCTVFLMQMGFDIAVKLNEGNKKQLVSDVEKNPLDSDDDAPEKEKEKETESDGEDESKVLNELLTLSLIEESNTSTLQKHQQQINLPSGFFKNFTPPPEQNLFLA